MDQVLDSWPSAEAVEASGDYQALVVAAAGKPERAMGDARIAAEPPAWKEVVRLAQQIQKRQPQHAFVLVSLVKAQTALRGIVGFSASMGNLIESLRTQWDSVFPQPDSDVPEDPYYGRTNNLMELSEDSRFLDSLYRYPLVNVRAIGTFSARDIDISTGIVDADEQEKARCQIGLIQGAFENTDPQLLGETADGFSSAVAAVSELETLFAEKANKLSLEKLKKRIADCQSRFIQYAEQHIVDEPALSAEEAESEELQETLIGENSATVNGGITEARTGNLVSRQEASDQLACIMAYYQTSEPSSPVVILAHRARSMIPQSFFELLQQLAPASQASFSELMGALERDPLAYIIEDSYMRFVGGEQVPNIDPGSLSTVIDSRKGVLAALADVEIFFREAEPSSPLPLLIKEMQNLVQKSFPQLIAEFSNYYRQPEHGEAGASNSADK